MQDHIFGKCEQVLRNDIITAVNEGSSTGRFDEGDAGARAAAQFDVRMVAGSIHQLDDVLNREGDRLCMFYGAANRDEEVFDDPDRFDIGRNPNRHLGFGWAEHYCLGAHLAKASIAALLEQMVERIDSIEPAGDRDFVAASFVHGYKNLPVRINWA